MRMRDEDMLNALNLPRRESADIAEIEEKGAFLEQRLDVDRRIAEAPVEQSGMQERSHY